MVVIVITSDWLGRLLRLLDFYYSLQAILEVAAGQAEIAVTVLQAAPLWTGHVDAVARLHLSCPPGRFL